MTSSKIRVGVQRAKHLVQVYIWGGISNKGATNIIFTEIMNAECLGMIFEVGLLPFVRDHFPDGNRLQQDNDPKHASGYIDNFCKENGMNWWCTPPESPDLNIWGSLKQYLRNIYKPKNLAQLKEGIQQFWLTLTPEVCTQYIMHLKKVMPKVKEEEGGPSGF